ncbi:hypothetical protein [uncultured Flavobacterium sp.]|uniref:DUF6922 domain-containing protein n=1 Tax=uncultured Flavobacterium sp. TaxID=165435 RepID=UPI0030CA465D|tara:strand:- start:76 stop:381 length:306 start_codon:yes stop_codon:yes gene_type:complete
MQQKITINAFSQHLFWDVDKTTFDLNFYKEQMISKVLKYGNWNDWVNLKAFYGLNTIKEVTLNLRSLDAITLSYVSTIFNIDKSEFRGYKHRQLVQNSSNS